MKKNKNIIIILIIGIILIGACLFFFYRWMPCFEDCESVFCDKKVLPDGTISVSLCKQELSLGSRIICSIECCFGINILYNKYR